MRLLIIVIVFGGLVSCSSSPRPAPIVDAKPFQVDRPKAHVVAQGETLYSIALRYDLDYKKISEINGIGLREPIHPGQVLNLDISRYVETKSSRANKPATATRSTSERSKKQTLKVDKKNQNATADGAIYWRWPVQGKVLERFAGESGLNKGIDIRGKLGEPVVAAADGVVVFSRSGLRGYGNLIIVEHNKRYLSAYGHNRVILVQEGEQVRAGQTIAEVGSSGTSTAKLHFEIRLDGVPVDPLRYLPRLK